MKLLVLLFQILIIVHVFSGGDKDSDDERLNQEINERNIRVREQERREQKRLQQQHNDRMRQQEQEHNNRLREIQKEKEIRQKQFEELEQLRVAENEKQRKLAEQQKQIQQEIEIAQNKLAEENAKKQEIQNEYELLRKYPAATYQRTPQFQNGLQIGITGPSRAGKSTFINTFRDIKSLPELKNSGRNVPFAEVRSGEECTKIPTPYPADDLTTQFTLWDLPGYGTDNFHLKTYLRDMGLKYFNLVIVMTADVFREGDLEIMNELKRHNIPFIMIRNKVDETIKGTFVDEEIITVDEEPIGILTSIKNKLMKNENLSENEQQIENIYLNTLEKLRIALKNQEVDEVFFVSNKYANKDLYEMDACVEIIWQKIHKGIANMKEENFDPKKLLKQ